MEGKLGGIHNKSHFWRAYKIEKNINIFKITSFDNIKSENPDLRSEVGAPANYTQYKKREELLNKH